MPNLWKYTSLHALALLDLKLKKVKVLVFFLTFFKLLEGEDDESGTSQKYSNKNQEEGRNNKSMLSKMKMQLGVLWSTRMKIEILDSAQDLEFLSLAVLLAANLFKGIIYPTSWSIQRDHISHIHYASWLKDHSEEFCTWGLDWLSIRLWRLLNSTNKHHQHQQ